MDGSDLLTSAKLWPLLAFIRLRSSRSDQRPPKILPNMQPNTQIEQNIIELKARRPTESIAQYDKTDFEGVVPIVRTQRSGGRVCQHKSEGKLNT